LLVADTWTLATIFNKWLVYGSALVAAGGVWFVLAQPMLPAATRQLTVRVTFVAAVLGVLTTLGRLAVQAGYLIDEGWRGMIDPDILRLVLEGPLGTSSAVRVAALVLVAGLAVAGRRRVWLPATGAVLVAASFALSGHTSGDAGALIGSLLVLHLVAVSFWLGALWPLYRLADGSVPRAATAVAAERFGRQAVGIVAVLLAAGATLAWLLLGSVPALYATGYGRTLLAKLAFVGALLCLAAVNKWRLVPALGGTDRAAADRAAIALRRSIGVEAFIFAAVLLVSAVLTSATVLPAG